MADKALRSECTTILATLRCTKTSPGSSPAIWLAGTRLSEQPIHMYLGVCCLTRLVKNPGRSRSICSAHWRLWANRSEMLALVMIAFLAVVPALHRFREQLPPDQHAADLAGAGADLVQLGI